MNTNVEYKKKITLHLEDSVHSLFCPERDGYCHGKKCMAWKMHIDGKHGYCEKIERT